MRIVLLLSFLALEAPVQCQQTSIGLNSGASFYKGELTQHLDGLKLNPSIGVESQVQINKFTALQLGLLYSSLEGADSLMTDPYSIGRNLSFRTRILDFSTILIYYPLNCDCNPNTSGNNKLTPSLGIGISYFRFNPTAIKDGILYELPELETEGVSYQLGQISLPFLVGVKWSIVPRISAHLKYTYHRTFTDYLDDISTVYIDANNPNKDTAGLSNRRSELKTNDPNVPSEEHYGFNQSTGKGNVRGDPTDKDAFGFVSLSIHWQIGSGPD